MKNAFCFLQSREVLRPGAHTINPRGFGHRLLEKSPGVSLDEKAALLAGDMKMRRAAAHCGAAEKMRLPEKILEIDKYVFLFGAGGNMMACCAARLAEKYPESRVLNAILDHAVVPLAPFAIALWWSSVAVAVACYYAIHYGGRKKTHTANTPGPAGAEEKRDRPGFML
jgi:hypothetical protein